MEPGMEAKAERTRRSLKKVDAKSAAKAPGKTDPKKDNTTGLVHAGNAPK
jgi:hypothetical protein